jgi:hypothetical protein
MILHATWGKEQRVRQTSYTGDQETRDLPVHLFPPSWPA